MAAKAAATLRGPAALLAWTLEATVRTSRKLPMVSQSSCSERLSELLATKDCTKTRGGGGWTK